jgi:hypothetical protein
MKQEKVKAILEKYDKATDERVQKETIEQLNYDRALLLAALTDIVGAIKKARTTRAPAGHYDEDVYYNGIDFAPQIEEAAALLAKLEG